MKALPGLTARLLLVLNFVVVACAAAPNAPETPDAADRPRTIRFVDRDLYGPGPFPDQKLKDGYIGHMEFAGFMQATVKPFNNGAAEPNVSGEMLVGKEVNGRMSDATLINEHIDMGNAIIMNGQFNLLLGAVFGGPSGGASNFFLDRDYNWTIRDDIAIDPGFGEGVIKIHDFIFTTGPRVIPSSMQTEKHYPGGVDVVGSLRSGDVVVGRVGDDDFDGFVDGIFNAVGRFPIESVLLPGAPFVQRFQFVSDIPILPVEAALLSLAGARNGLRRYTELSKGGEPRLSAVDLLVSNSRERLEMAVRHLRRARDSGPECRRHCDEIRHLLEQVITSLRQVSDQGYSLALEKIDRAFAELRRVHSASIAPDAKAP